MNSAAMTVKNVNFQESATEKPILIDH